MSLPRVYILLNKPPKIILLFSIQEPFRRQLSAQTGRHTRNSFLVSHLDSDFSRNNSNLGKNKLCNDQQHPVWTQELCQNPQKITLNCPLQTAWFWRRWDPKCPHLSSFCFKLHVLKEHFTFSVSELQIY